jgi:hypothetical protein
MGQRIVSNYLKNLSNIEKNWKESMKQSELGCIDRIFRDENYKDLLKEELTKNWILETLKLEKKMKKFKECTTLIMVGSGMYPYSMLDTYRRFPHIKQVGLDKDDRCVLISKELIKRCNLENSIQILNADSIEYNYSSLLDEDLVFLSCDIDNIDETYNKILETSKAQPYVCAPGKLAWLTNTFKF